MLHYPFQLREKILLSGIVQIIAAVRTVYIQIKLTQHIVFSSSRFFLRTIENFHDVLTALVLFYHNVYGYIVFFMTSTIVALLTVTVNAETRPVIRIYSIGYHLLLPDNSSNAQPRLDEHRDEASCMPTRTPEQAVSLNYPEVFLTTSEVLRPR